MSRQKNQSSTITRLTGIIAEMKGLSRQIIKNVCYIEDMAAGRPSSLERTEFGKRLYDSRKRAGLTQKETADALSVSQQFVAFWERQGKSLPADLLGQIAKLYNISTDMLLGIKELDLSSGPVGKLRKSFEKASKLSRKNQEKIAEVVDALVATHSK